MLRGILTPALSIWWRNPGDGCSPAPKIKDLPAHPVFYQQQQRSHPCIHQCLPARISRSKFPLADVLWTTGKEICSAEILVEIVRGMIVRGMPEQRRGNERQGNSFRNCLFSFLCRLFPCLCSEQCSHQPLNRVLLGFKRRLKSERADGFAGFRADGRELRLRELFQQPRQIEARVKMFHR